MIINSDVVKEDVRRALAEDVGTGDVSAALISAELKATAVVISREPMLVCGIPWFNMVMREVDRDIRVSWLVEEGDWLAEPTTLCRIHGSARHLLTAERTALNFLQTVSATATQTRAYLEAIKGTHARLLDTRKTIPGLRMAQKYAVACAGAMNHRIGLYDALLIKENHIKACGSIAVAIIRAREATLDLLIEVEVQNLDEFSTALSANPDRILLDNFSLEQLREAVKMNNNDAIRLEASGGVTLSTIKAVAETGVDFISVGDITKSIRAIDLSFLIQEME